MRYQVTRGRRAVLLAVLVFGAVFMTVSCMAPSPVAGPATRPSPTRTQPPAPPVTVPSGFTYVPLLDNTPVMPHKDEEPAEVLTTLPFMMRPGDVLRVTDQLDVRIPSGHGSEVNNEIVCFDQNPENYPDNPIGHASTGTNVGKGVNGSDAYQWNVSMLIRGPAGDPSLSYFCQIWTYASDQDTNYVMNVLAPAPGQTTYGTWLEVSTGSEVGAQEWQFFTCTPTTPKTCCTPEDANHTCRYIGGSGRPAAATLDAGSWLAGDGAATFDAVATFQITDCWAHFGGLFGGTSSCLPDDRGDGIFGQSNAEGQTWLEADQLYPNGSVCQVNRAYSEESTGGQVQLSESYHDSDAQHHLPLYYDLSAPVSQLCGGSRRFAVDLYIEWTAGNPVKLDGGNINVIDSAYAKTTIVPDVTGLPQAQADAAIQTAGLTDWPPDYVASTTPPGTVVGENSPAGTVVPAGSPVQLAVSLGYATVPNVIGDPAAKAEAEIRSAGLTPTVNSSATNCVHPDIVQGQSPGGGTQVAPGSRVDIGITTCTR